MRVLFLNDLWDPRIGSSIRQMYRQAERLRELGHETLVVSTTEDPDLVGTATVEGSEVRRLFSSYPLRFRAWVALSHESVLGPLREILAEWQPDVVHSHLIHTHLSYGALTAAKRAGAAVVFTAHDSMTYCYQKLSCFHGGEAHDHELKDYRAYWQKCVPCQRLRFRPGRNRAIRRVLARDVDRFTVVSDELGRAIGENGIRVDRTIHNAIRPTRRLPDPAQVEAFRERLGLGDAPTIATGGRLHDLKGVRQLFEMLAALRAEFPGIRLLVLGHAEAWKGFEPVARAYGVDDLVVPTGWLDGEELARALSSIDVLVSPSICFETFGMMNLEAAEHGRPVVTTSFGGCPEAIEDGRTGFVANPFHIAEFAERIAQLLRDPELRREMGEAGRRMVAERFSIERLTQEFLEEYALAVDKNSAGIAVARS